MLNLSKAEMTVLVGGMRALGANAGESENRYFYIDPRNLNK